jgi:hypothetical protein
MKKALIVGLMVVVGLFALVVAVVAVTMPSGSVAASDGAYSVELAMLTVPVADVEPLVEAPHQYLGVPHPPPQFDTSDIGPDLSLQQDTSDLPSLDADRVLRAVYLGHDVNGSPYHIWQSGSPDLRRMIGQIIADFGAVGRLGTSYGGLVVGSAPWERERPENIAENGMTDGSIRSSSDGPTTFTLEWHALPEEVAAVVLYDNGEPVGWQRPVSGTVAFQFIIDDGDPQAMMGRDAEMAALTATGEEWNRYGWSTGFTR